MPTTKLLLILLLAPLLSLHALGQQTTTPAPSAEQVQMLLSDEQVRLVHSQPYYAAGERLWYKAFLSKSSTVPPSKTLYVELLDIKGELIVRQRLILEEGMAYGDIQLPYGLPTGQYTLLATTNWMRNFSSKQQHRENLLILNAEEVVALRGKSPVEASQQLTVRFFPESNSMLEVVKTIVAAVVTNAAGVGVVAKGEVKDSGGETVASFQTDDSGVGVFQIVAAPLLKYEAMVEAKGYQTQSIPLPEAKQQGLALAVEEQTEDGLKVKVHGTAAWVYTLLAESGGNVYFSHRATAGGTVTIPWQDSSKNAVRLLLLNPGGMAEAELMVVRQQREASVKVSTDKPQYSPRQKVSVTLQSANAEGRPTAANIAVAVTGMQKHFQLPLAKSKSSNVKEQAAPVHGADKELWNSLIQGKAEAKYELEPLVDVFSRAGVAEPFISSSYSTRTDTGFVQALPENAVNYALQHYHRTRINDAYNLTEAHAIAPIAKLPADKVFKLDEYVAFKSMDEAIREATTNLRLSRKKGRYVMRLLYVRPGVKRMLKNEPVYLIDGVVVNGMEEILNLNLDDIATFELTWMEEKLYAANLGHMAENGGLFAVYTKSGEVREKLKSKGYRTMYEQYNRPGIFMASANTATGATPDFKQLVFWEPQLELAKDGSASFSFFTSDETGVFTIRVEGQTAEGIPISGEAQYEVRLLK
ncbi:hypothetical protein [uncultured Pontibacter sp.]|uniref:hypothetical protein n=1 Tax=uncultured Pontibacter sp. TaxID=453356 RepID=UPI00261A8014|nr:hypothetical protein [uncultured Pontibacter sp.]